MHKNIILLVDSDGDSEQAVSKVTTRLGRDLLVAKTSREAFEMISDKMQQLNAVIVDVDPGAHGLALLEAISSCADTAPIIVITALEETYMKAISQEHGATACLGKPITAEKLQATLADVARHWGLTSDRWGTLVPRPIDKKLNIRADFRGIAAKLSPTVSTPRKNS